MEILKWVFSPLPQWGYSGNPQLHNLDVGRYFTDRVHIPFIRWGTLSDSANTHYDDDVAGNPFIRYQLFFCNRNTCTQSAPPVSNSPENLDCHEFRVGGKRPKDPKPASTHPQRAVDERILKIGTKSLRIWFLLDNPQTEDKGDLLLRRSDGDSEFYARQGRRFIQELAPAQSFYNEK